MPHTSASSERSDPRGHDASDLLGVVYAELRELAQHRLCQERPGHTLTATALVHDAYVKLAGERRVQWKDEGHFLSAAAEAMRQILLDHARAKGRIKRGGNSQRLPLSVLDLAAEPDSDQILALDHHFRRLEKEHPEAADVVRLRFFAGLTVDRTAEALSMSPRQVNRLWAVARAWLFRAMHEEKSGP